MSNNEVLNDKWIKASIIGTTWAASEIVLGSFMHNLKIPFSSNILTMIGIIILISVSYIWSEKGLYWRAGLICALMKTISPSAVIFGPMIAIFSQSLLLELTTRFLGRNAIGFISGAMLALSWNLFQKIIKFIILYGFNIVDLYEDLLRFTQKQLNIDFEILWLPIIILLIVYCILGLITAIIGMKVGKKTLTHKIEQLPIYTANNSLFTPQKRDDNFNYSISWLATNLILIITALFLISYTSWAIWSICVIAIISLWTLRYKRALMQLMKPKFWIFFVIITMLAALVFSYMQPESKRIYDGLLIGMEMNFRAAIVILGFAVLGTEFYNPIIRKYFQKTRFKQLPLALELSFESLPSIIASVPDFKTLAKNPTLILSQLISQTETRLEQIKSKLSKRRKIYFITGKIGQGKTKTIKELVNILNKKQIKIGGIYNDRIMDGDETIGYDVVNIRTNNREPFLRVNNNSNQNKIGKFSINNDGLNFGINVLSHIAIIENDITVIDEVGKLEIRDEGWGSSVSRLINDEKTNLIIAVRDVFLADVIAHWQIENYTAYSVYPHDVNKIADQIIKDLS